MTKNEVYDFLTSQKIAYQSFEHAAVFTMEELYAQDIPNKNRIVKNLFLRDDKKRNYYLVVVTGDKQTNLKQLSQTIPSRKLSFAKEPELKDFLGLEPGHVTPLGILNNREKNVMVVFDEELKGHDIGIHPMENTATIFLSFDDIYKIVEEHGNPLTVCKI